MCTKRACHGAAILIFIFILTIVSMHLKKSLATAFDGAVNFFVCFTKSIPAPHPEPERLGWPKRISIPRRQRD